MDFFHLEAYVKVFELRHFSKAAEKLHISQPSISSYIKSLEEELDTQLIYRSTKEFIPTKAGKIFYQYAVDMLSLRENLFIAVKDTTNQAEETLSIVASSVPAQYILPKLLGKFCKLKPNIVYNLEQLDTKEVVDNISSYRNEIGFVGAKIDSPNCLYQSFCSEKMIMIAPLTERFLKPNQRTLKELLASENFIGRENGSGTRLRYEKYLNENDINPKNLKICALFNNTQSVIQAVANGLGIAIVSNTQAQDYLKHKSITKIDFKGLPTRKFYIVTNKNRVQTPLIGSFIKFILDQDYNNL